MLTLNMARATFLLLTPKAKASCNLSTAFPKAKTLVTFCHFMVSQPEGLTFVTNFKI